jgi:hypothetical protein
LHFKLETAHFAPLLIAVAIAIGSPLAAFSQTRLLPVDEAAFVPDFLSFRSQLRAAVAKRDLKFILAAMSNDVKLSFGGEEGLSEFVNLWKPESPDCRRRFKSEPPRRPNVEPGVEADVEMVGCG